LEFRHISTDFQEERMKKILTILCLALALAFAACGGKSDADLQKAAETAVKAKAPSVTVAVKDGVVTLSGEVADAATKTAAETAAKVEGVKSVTNNITVKPTPTPTPATANTADKTKIEDALKKAGCATVTVDITTTPMTLKGTVPKGKKVDCVKAAQEAAGKPVKADEVTEK
jgi:hyperosmotically inducible periplasmic protein